MAGQRGDYEMEFMLFADDDAQRSARKVFELRTILKTRCFADFDAHGVDGGQRNERERETHTGNGFLSALMFP